ncbi:MAG: tol-pal system protein YbgF [Deltaproteobacteria bacterium]|nr:MAG: tol-pal system protein YbgF [Deltaproteobacteria bacterium]
MKIKLSKNTVKAVTALAVAALFIPGCVAVDPNLASPQARTQQTHEELQKLKRKVDEFIENQPKQTDQAERLARLGATVDSMESDIRLLKGKVEELEHSLANPTAQATPATTPEEITALRNMVSDLTNRVDSLNRRIASTTSTKASAAAPPAPAKPPAPAVAAPAKPSSPEVDPKSLYDKGYSLYQQNKYEEARKAFDAYISAYPKTSLADNAYFWIGESFYNESQYEKAIIFYDKIVREYADGDKVPSALLKQAFAFDALGDELDAKILLRKVIKEHPKSEQASVARRKLEVLGD